MYVFVLILFDLLYVINIILIDIGVRVNKDMFFGIRVSSLV